MQIDKFTLAYKPKVDRTLANLPGDCTDQQILVEYDRLGGAITVEGKVLERGCFFNPETRKAHEEVTLKFSNVELVENDDGTTEAVVKPRKRAAKKAAKKTTRKPKS